MVDDNPFNLSVCKQILSELEFEIVLSANGNEAIELLETAQKEGSKTFKLILMDLEMPFLDGFEVTKILREKMNAKILAEIPIIGLSGHEHEGILKKCFEVGMNEYLKKPLECDAVRKIIEKYKI